MTSRADDERRSGTAMLQMKTGLSGSTLIEGICPAAN
jgi:hypothetical protein